jgi:hypothetical protein
LNELAFDLRQLGIQQSSIAVDVIPVRTHAGDLLVEHLRHS